MATITKDDFLGCIKSSKVIDEHVLAEFLQQVDSDDPKQIAMQLVSRDLLTKWQAKYLISGRHVLQIGNYRLLERIKRDDLGDRFLAVHMQLGRKVEIQLLPAELTKNDAQRESFISNSSAAVTIDHPNIVHVYDIDQEGGRLFLVVEHTDGKPLSEYPVEQLSDVDIARIVKQVSSGLLEAHNIGLVHGQLTPDNILITTDELAKLQNLSMSSLSELAVKSEPRDDINSLGKLGVQLLSRTKRSVGPQAKKTLYDLLSWLGTTDAASVTKIIAKLDGWIIQHNEETQNTIKSLESNGALGDVLGNGVLEHPANRAVSSSRNPRKTGANGKSKSEKKGVEEIESRKVSPQVLIATLVVGGALLIGGVSWFAFAMTGSGKKTNEQAQSTPRVRNADSNKVIAIKKSEEPKSTKPSSLGDGLDDKALQDMLAAGKASKPDRDPTLEPETIENPVAENPVAENPVATQTPDPTNPPTENGANPPPSQTTASDPPTMPADAVETPATGDPPPATTGEQQTAENNPGPEPDESKPFKDFPKHIDLPAIDDVTPQQVGSIYTPRNYLLVAELLTGEQICKSRIQFSLNRDEQNKQRWVIDFQRRRSDEPKSVAAFSFVDNVIFFEWLPTATEDEYVQYFRNCAIKFTSKDSIGFLSLRKPVIIEGFSISADALEKKLETELAWLPDPDSLVVELQPFKYDELGAIFANRLVNRKNPGYVYFSEKENQKFAWLEVTTELRKTLRLNLELKILNAPSSKKSLEFLATTAANFKQMADEASFKYNQVKDATKPDQMTWTEFDTGKKRLKENAAQSQALAADTIELQNKLPSLFDRQIPLTVYFEMNGVRTILAQSNVEE